MIRFDMGRTVATPQALRVLAEAGVAPGDLILKHAMNEWGDVSRSDARANDEALRTGARILSAYKVGDSRLWVVTEAADDDGRRAATTILLPSEY